MIVSVDIKIVMAKVSTSSSTMCVLIMYIFKKNIRCWLYTQWKNISLVECKKVESAFSPFAGTWSNFVLRFPLYFILTYCFFHKYVNTLNWNMHYGSKMCHFNICKKMKKTQFRPKCHLRSFCIRMKICNVYYKWYDLGTTLCLLHPT